MRPSRPLVRPGMAIVHRSGNASLERRLHMARNRLNPWPSVADLFSALTVVAFASLIFVTLGVVIVDDNKRIEIKAGERLANIFKTEYGAAVGTRPCAYFTDRGSVFRLENVCQALPSFDLNPLVVVDYHYTKGYKN